MRAVKTGKPDEFTYGAPPGTEGQIGGLPCTREHDPELDATIVYSEWEPDPLEREAIAAGARIRLGIVGEPIPPVSVNVAGLDGVYGPEGAGG